MVTPMDRGYIVNDLPNFLQIYSPEMCYSKLKIPSGFLKFFNGDIPLAFLLEVEGPARRSWRVVREEIQEDFFFKGGWPNFVQDNNLEFGDYLTFSYVGNSNFYVRIYGKYGYMKADLTAIEELELHRLDEENAHATQEEALLADQALDGSVNSGVSVRLFEVVMKKFNFQKMIFNIPAAFGNKYMKKGQKFEKMATLLTDGANWPVVVRGSDRLKFRKGWREFVRDNDLRVGDVLCFKLIDEENFILKVRIRRNPNLNEV
ncbi:B3 domain-containing protein At4g34400-like [Lycium ferocissimum]|uniref:B3 domain-containing protein At4g34400-like n=1 Tax=Lycium ferocissimum TaxID=112874 RepID=UPI002814E8FB|nr:B3 domain-containing protein At4g34400-like [Lycium ferocissimum]